MNNNCIYILDSNTNDYIYIKEISTYNNAYIISIVGIINPSCKCVVYGGFMNSSNIQYILHIIY